ncbi:hypothetical protein D3C80_1416860 [compost metagenome]
MIIQFIRPSKNKAEAPSTNSIATQYSVPADVQQSLDIACMDCHSNNTNYPWYTNIQPVGWWLQKHVNDGKRHLNFSEFTAYTPKKANHKLDEVIESQHEGWMPIDSYLWIHKDAKLTQQQKDAIVSWATGIQQQIQTANPGVDFKSK